MGCSASISGTVSTVQNEKVDHRNQMEQCNYKKIDKHARKAPNSAKHSAQELVNYMLSFSKDPRMLARGFFVWGSENIKYDVEGYFGKAPMAPCDAESVMKNGLSVCEGYASVFELLCRKADIPAKKIVGFSKGYGYSADKPITPNTGTSHAWNAVQLEGKWYLLDSTWASGHIESRTNSFNKEFDDFYFLTDPKQFVSTHFPYMDDNLEESQKWQLLSKPLTLEEFNKNLVYNPAAFKLGAQPVSHPHGYFKMKNEVQITFRSAGKEEIIFSASLMLEEGNWLKEQVNTTFGYLENGIYRLLVRPPKPGTYNMRVFGHYISLETFEYEHLFDYIIKCNEVEENDFKYPVSYEAADRERCILHEPLNGMLPANAEVKFRVSAPHHKRVMVEEVFLKKSGTMFTGNVTTHAKRSRMVMVGTSEHNGFGCAEVTEFLYEFFTL